MIAIIDNDALKTKEEKISKKLRTASFNSKFSGSY